jgi:hypothetical protein
MLDVCLSGSRLMYIFRLWNYNPTNDNTHGDHWNGEDFSIFSRMQEKTVTKDGQNSEEELPVGNFEIDVQKLKTIDQETTEESDGTQAAINHWHKGGRVLDAVIVSVIHHYSPSVANFH